MKEEYERCWCAVTLCLCHGFRRLMWDQLKCPWPDAHLLSEARELLRQLGIPLLQPCRLLQSFGQLCLQSRHTSCQLTQNSHWLTTSYDHLHNMTTTRPSQNSLPRSSLQRGSPPSSHFPLSARPAAVLDSPYQQYFGHLSPTTSYYHPPVPGSANTALKSAEKEIKWHLITVLNQSSSSTIDYLEKIDWAFSSFTEIS